MRTIFSGKQWLVGHGLTVSGSHMGKQLIEFGATGVLVIAGSRGTGTISEAEGMECLDLDLVSPDMMTGIRNVDATLRNLPAHVLDRIARFDPNKTAHAVGAIWLTGDELANRPLLGARPKSWQALEDKMVADALWDSAGIQRAPSAIVAADLDALKAASAHLDQGMGTIWVGDNREGWHGGATKLRWVREPSHAVLAHRFLSKQCDRIRVMPFIDGIPCSIHAFVVGDEILSVRPCEMLVFRRPASSILHYAGAATTWVPSQTQSNQMHDAVTRVGRVIHKKVGYQGTFTLDGICNADGFFPTEINPRFGGALGRMSSSLPELPVYHLHNAIAAGTPLDLRLPELVELIVDAAETNPVSKAMYILEGVSDPEPEKVFIALQNGQWKVTAEEAESHGSMQLGPSNAGSIILVQIDPKTIPKGHSAAPSLTKALMLAGRHWGVEMEPLLPAPDLR